MSEPCIEWKDIIPRTVLKEIEKKYDKKGHWSVATSNCLVGSHVKPGGSLIYHNGDSAGRLTETGTDPWGYGRWASKRLRGKNDTSLLIIAGYTVGPCTKKAGSSMA